MTENVEENPLNNSQSESISGFQNSSSDDVVTRSEIKNMIDKIMENQENSDNFNRKFVENILEKVTEKFESMEKQLEESEQNESNQKMMEKLSEKLESIGKELEEVKDQKKPIKLTVPPIDTRSNQQKTLSSIPMSPRQFVIKHVFKDVSKMEDRVALLSHSQEHCGVRYYIGMYREGENAKITLVTDKEENSEHPWSITANLLIKLHQSNGQPVCKEVKWVYPPQYFPLNIEDTKNNYLVKDALSVELHVKIEKMSGIYPKNLREFDETNEECSDAIFIVGDEKFYVSKLYLATHSLYFKAMFLGGFDDSTMAEITLNGIDPDDFQKYLEVLYAESAINESTVEEILHIADMYDTPLVVRKCEKFLIEKSKKAPKNMLEMCVRYSLENLKQEVLNGIKTAADIKAVLPGDITDMDPSIMASLLEKSLNTK